MGRIFFHIGINGNGKMANHIGCHQMKRKNDFYMGGKMVAHDGTIIKYNVDLKENNIEMTVELYDGMQNICFYNTLTHYFAHILSGNVIGDIYEIEAKYFIEDNKDILWEGKKFVGR